MSVRFRWLGGFTVHVTWDGGSLYVDPYRLNPKKAPAADLVLVTNPRLGHLSHPDIEIARAGAVAGPPDCAAGDVFTPLEPGGSIEVCGAEVTAVPAGNSVRSFFPLSRGWLGYVIRVAGKTLYHAGATDVLPAGIRADVAFLPVSGRYLMAREDAVAAAETLGATTRVALLPVGDRFFDLPGFATAG